MQKRPSILTAVIKIISEQGEFIAYGRAFDFSGKEISPLSKMAHRLSLEGAVFRAAFNCDDVDSMALYYYNMNVIRKRSIEGGYRSIREMCNTLGKAGCVHLLIGLLEEEENAQG